MSTIKTTKKSVFQPFHSKDECFLSFNLNCFSVFLDYATTKHRTKSKEGMYTDLEKPNLNKQTKNPDLSTTLLM